MNAQRTADAMRRVACAIETAGKSSVVQFPQAMLEGEAAVGAAGFLCYLRDMFTATPKETFTRDEILVILEVCSRDGKIFPFGTGSLIWHMEDE